MGERNTHVEGLPDRGHILLTEFVTWVLDGQGLDDAALKKQDTALQAEDRRIWGSIFGPGDSLVYQLKLLRDGHAEYPGRTMEHDPGYESCQGYFLHVQRWLGRRGGSVEEALRDVVEEIARRKPLESGRLALESHMFEQAATGKLVIKARRWDYDKGYAASEYEAVPADFFLRPCRLFSGMFTGPSELVRWPDGGSQKWLFDSVFNRNDPPASYVEAKIARVDAIRLKTEFTANQAADDSESLCRDWLIAEIRKSPAAPPMPQKGFLTAALTKFPGLSKEGFKRARKEALASQPNENWSKGGRPRKNPSEKPLEKK